MKTIFVFRRNRTPVAGRYIIDDVPQRAQELDTYGEDGGSGPR